MGRKRKTVTFADDEDKTSNACHVTTRTEEKVHSHTENPNDLQEKKKRSSTDINVFVRRSGRIKSSVLSSGNEGGEKVKPDLVEHINVVEIENENEEAAEVITTVPEVNDETNLQENDDYVSIAADEFKSKVDKGPQEGCYPNFSYKSLYIASQKKIEALMEANYELVKKLEFALGKVEAYEKMSFGWGASNGVILASNMGKEKEATVSLSPQTVQKCIDPPLNATTDAIDVIHNRNKKSYKKRKAKVCSL